ncbi:hypothetical protein WA158_000021 [Blastocystis sp. Blastoise]
MTSSVIYAKVQFNGSLESVPVNPKDTIPEFRKHIFDKFGIQPFFQKITVDEEPLPLEDSLPEQLLTGLSFIVLERSIQELVISCTFQNDSYSIKAQSTDRLVSTLKKVVQLINARGIQVSENDLCVFYHNTLCVGDECLDYYVNETQFEFSLQLANQVADNSSQNIPSNANNSIPNTNSANNNIAKGMNAPESLDVTTNQMNGVPDDATTPVSPVNGNDDQINNLLTMNTQPDEAVGVIHFYHPLLHIHFDYPYTNTLNLLDVEQSIQNALQRSDLYQILFYKQNSFIPYETPLHDLNILEDEYIAFFMISSNFSSSLNVETIYIKNMSLSQTNDFIESQATLTEADIDNRPKEEKEVYILTLLSNDVIYPYICECILNNQFLSLETIYIADDIDKILFEFNPEADMFAPSNIVSMCIPFPVIGEDGMKYILPYINTYSNKISLDIKLTKESNNLPVSVLISQLNKKTSLINFTSLQNIHSQDEELKGMYKQLEDRYNKLKNENDNYRVSNTKLITSIASLRLEYNQYKKEIEEKQRIEQENMKQSIENSEGTDEILTQEQVKMIRKELQQVKLSLNQANMNLLIKDKERSELQENYEELLKEKEKKNVESSYDTKVEEEMKTLIEKLPYNSQVLATELTTVKKHVEELEKENAEYKSKMKEVDKGMQDLNERNVEILQANVEMKDDNTELNEMNTQLRKQLEELNDKYARLNEEHQSWLPKLDMELTVRISLLSQINHLEEEMNKIIQERNDQKQLLIEYEGMSSKEFNVKKSETRKMRQQLLIQEEEIKTLKAINSSLVDENARAKELKEAYDNKLDVQARIHLSENSTVKSLSNEIKNLRDDLTRYTKQKDEDKKEINKSKKDLKAMVEELYKVKQAYDELLREKDTVDKELINVRSVSEDMIQEKTHYLDDIQVLQTKLSASENAEQDLKSKLSQVMLEINNITTDIRDRNDEISQLNIAIKEREDELVALYNRIENYEQYIHQLEGDNIRISGELSKLTNSKDGKKGKEDANVKKSQLDEERKKVESLEEEIRQLKSTKWNSKDNEEMKALQEEKEHIQESYDNLKKHADELDKSLNKLTAEVATYKTNEARYIENTTMLNGTINKLKIEINVLCEQIRQLKFELGKYKGTSTNTNGNMSPKGATNVTLGPSTTSNTTNNANSTTTNSNTNTSGFEEEIIPIMNRPSAITPLQSSLKMVHTAHKATHNKGANGKAATEEEDDEDEYEYDYDYDSEDSMESEDEAPKTTKNNTNKNTNANNTNKNTNNTVNKTVA